MKVQVFRLALILIVAMKIVLAGEIVPTGNIIGQVTDESSGSPIVDGYVAIYNNLGQHLETDSINNSGEFVFTGLYPGTYYIQTRYTRYIDEAWNNFPCPNRSCAHTAGTPIEIIGFNTFIANFALDIGERIHGKVTHNSGHNITDGSVAVFDFEGNSLSLTSTSIGEEGNYSYTGLTAGTYYARTRYTGFFDELWDDIPCAHGDCIITSGTPIILPASTVSTKTNFILRTGGRIKGTITDDLGQPITSNVFINIYDSSGSYLGYTSSVDNEGKYSYGGLATGTYYAKAKSSNHINELWDDIPCFNGCDVTTGSPVVVSEDVFASIADFQLDTGSSISGVISDTNDSPVPRYSLVQLHSSTGYVDTYTLNNDLGEYSFHGLPAATYYVRTITDDFLDELWSNIPCVQGNCIPSSGTPIIADGTNQITVDFSLELGYSISGTVRTNDTNSPIIIGYIKIYDSIGEEFGIVSISNTGQYHYGGLLPGGYYVRTHLTGYIDELWDGILCAQGNCDITSGTYVVINDNNQVANFHLDTVESDVIFTNGFE